MTDIDALLAEMTLEEKISLLAGRDTWYTVPVPRLNIPTIKVTDGPNGVRGAWRDNGPPSICIPVGVALGATWNPALVERAAGVLAAEVKRKGAHILLAPTVNMHRSPIAGRNFECFAEDPYLSGQMAIAYVNGLQRNGVGACIKHFVANDQEFERSSISAEVRERPLRELYLEPFRLAQAAAEPWTVMSAYNRVNGVFASESDRLLQEILKEEWGFDGLVISDWFGTYTPRVPAGGLDLEMPGPARWMGADQVRAALDDGSLTEAALDDKVRRLLRTAVRLGAFDRPAAEPFEETGADLPEERAIIRAVAQETIVLLRNDGILPLDEKRLKRIAVIGELARWPNVLGGGSAEVKTHRIVSPLEGIAARAGDGVDVVYAPGCLVRKMLPAPDLASLSTAGGESGLDLALYDNLDFAGEPAFTQVADVARFGWFDQTVPFVNQARFTLRLSGFFTPRETGRHTFGLRTIGAGRLGIGGEWVIDNMTQPAYEEKRAEVTLEAGQPVELVVEYRWEGGTFWRAVEVGHLPPQEEDLLGTAVAAAAEADVAIVIAGLTNEWESEGFDRVDMALPGKQNELIRRVAAANPNTIVVLNVGSPVEMPWLAEVKGVVNQWYNGQEASHALADILFGDVNPSGKLPTTFPVRLADNPAYINFPGENGRVHYGEGLYIGYRYYDRKELAPLFPFGHGLSYTTFVYDNLEVSAESFTADEGVVVRCDVTNSGAVAGREVVQLYVRDFEATLDRPDKELKAFAKVALAPGERQTVTLRLDREAFWYYDPARGGWQVEPGKFELLIGASSRDIRLRTTVRIAPDADAKLTTASPLHILLADPHARSVLAEYFGNMLALVEAHGLQNQSLEQLAHFAPNELSPAKLAEIDAALAGANRP